MLECKINHALGMMGDSEKCMPWWLPPVDQEIRLCSPYEAKNFSTKIHIMAQDVCKVVFEPPARDAIFGLTRPI